MSEIIEENVVLVECWGWIMVIMMNWFDVCNVINGVLLNGVWNVI